MTDHIPAVTDRDVYITRSFDAPVAVVWKFWTEPELLARWFGPHGITIDPATVTIEASEGGAWNLQMSDENGVYPVESTLVKVIEHEYLEGVMSARTAAGEIEKVVLRVQFHDHGDKTRITLHQGPFTPELRDMTRDGWNESFEKIDALVAAAGEQS